MRLLKLSLVFLGVTAVCGFASQAVSVSLDTPAVILVPPHPLAELSNRMADSWFARGVLRLPNGVVFYGPPPGAFRQYLESRRNRRIDPDPKMNLMARSGVEADTCFKLRKYIFQPKEQTKSDGLRPLEGPMQQVGETDCTYANKVWPKSAEGDKPKQPDVGFYSTVLRVK